MILDQVGNGNKSSGKVLLVRSAAGAQEEVLSGGAAAGRTGCASWAAVRATGVAGAVGQVGGTGRVGDGSAAEFAGAAGAAWLADAAWACAWGAGVREASVAGMALAK